MEKMGFLPVLEALIKASKAGKNRVLVINCKENVAYSNQTIYHKKALLSTP